MTSEVRKLKKGVNVEVVKCASSEYVGLQGEIAYVKKGKRGSCFYGVKLSNGFAVAFLEEELQVKEG